MSSRNLALEVCVDLVQSALRLVSLYTTISHRTELELELFENACRSYSAARGGADRLEVCGNLGIGGGTTPSLGLVRVIQKALPHLPIMVGWSLSMTDTSYVIRIPRSIAFVIQRS
jgi:copper homeostasis protein